MVGPCENLRLIASMWSLLALALQACRESAKQTLIVQRNPTDIVGHLRHHHPLAQIQMTPGPADVPMVARPTQTAQKVRFAYVEDLVRLLVANACRPIVDKTANVNPEPASTRPRPSELVATSGFAKSVVEARVTVAVPTRTAKRQPARRVTVTISAGRSLVNSAGPVMKKRWLVVDRFLWTARSAAQQRETEISGAMETGFSPMLRECLLGIEDSSLRTGGSWA